MPLPNKPMNLTVPPQGHRSIIAWPVRAAVPQVIGQAFDGPTTHLSFRSKESHARS
jgi:hypothetical protein